MVFTLVFGVASAEMTDQSDFDAFCVLRWLGGGTGTVAVTLGSGTIMEVFFLHQRGKAFACFTMAILMGVTIAPTFSAFIVGSVQDKQWNIQYWWTVGADAVTIVLIFLFLEETGWTREGGRVYPKPPKSWIKNRMATFFLGTRVMPRTSAREALDVATDELLIGLCPVTVLSGIFLLIVFGWVVGLNTVLSIFIQEPVSEGGYGFTPIQNAALTFSLWIGNLAGQLFGHLLNDRLPLWICRRKGGIFEPEMRLHCLWFPAGVLVPVSLGLFGAALQYHLHYMVIAVALFLFQMSECALLATTITYITECFPEYPAEVNASLNFYRLLFGLFTNFFLTAWQDRTGIGWVYGMQAFFSIAAFMLMIFLMFRGKQMRALSFRRYRKHEQVGKVIDAPEMS